MPRPPRSLIAAGSDLVAKASTPTIRAGLGIQRVAYMAGKGVHDSVIAAQMTANSRNGHRYSEATVREICAIFEDSKSAPIITAEQTNGLVHDQATYGTFGAQPA